MGKINASDKIMSEKQRKRENIGLKFLHKSSYKILFRHRIHRRADARGSADIIHRI